MSCECVIPAAGSSRRMGSWKPLIPWKGSTLVEASVRAALDAGLDRVFLVAGYRGEELVPLFRGESRVSVLMNPSWERGMLGSIQTALPLVRSSSFFVSLADMPLVSGRDYQRLEEAVLRVKGEGRDVAGLSAFSAFGGEVGHPVLIPSSLIGEILGLPPDTKLRPYLLAKGAFLVEAGSRAVLEDLDTPADLERLSGKGAEA